MLSQEILSRIETGEITSRTQLYKEVGRSTPLLHWLNEQGILLPQRWSRQTIVQSLKAEKERLGRIPRANDVTYALLAATQRHFGTWNESLYQAFGVYNQRRYSHFSNDDLIQFLEAYIIKYQRIPHREEFDGTHYPYWEVYTERFGVRTWAEIIGMADLSQARYYTKHGWGSVRWYQGVVYLSHVEYLIGKYLTDLEIKFEKEVPYGNSNHVFDFYLPDFNAYIECYGIGTQEYMDRVEEKRSHYDGRTVIEIFKHDNTLDKLSSEVQRLQSSSGESSERYSPALSES